MLSKGPRGREFDILIERTVAPSDIEWMPRAERIRNDLGGGGSYCELARFGWNAVRDLIALERDAIDQVCRADDLLAGYDRWIWAVEEGDAPSLIGLDLGTNALTAALWASRHLPYYSCNGSTFGDSRSDEHPVIAFLCRRPLLSFIDDAAREAGVGLMPNWMQGITAYCRNVDAFIDMAEGLYERRAQMAAISIREPKSAAEADDRQGTLF